MRDIGPDPVVIVGFSMGAAVALEAGRQAGDLVRGIVTVDAFHDPHFKFSDALAQQSGVLMSETQSIKSRDRASTHSYSLSYRYDRNDRRRSLSLSPGNLFPGSAMTYSYTGWGALSAVSDIGGNSYSFSYNGRDELTNVGYPAGVTQTLAYDAAGRLTSDNITQPNRGAFPYVLGSSLRSFGVGSRDARGKIRASADGAAFSGSFPQNQSYDPMGHVTATKINQSGYILNNGLRTTFLSADTLSYDGLGNILTSSGFWGLTGASAQSHTSTNTYTSANRLSTRVSTPGPRTTTYQYDASGSVRFEVTTASGSSGNVEERASFLDGSDRIVAVDLRKSGRTMLEEFRYDPFGRRVWVSNTTRCAPTSAIECLISGVRRIIWDGDQELAEIQAPRDTTNAALEELDSHFPVLPSVTLGAGQYGDPNTHFGRVVYSPGLAVDQPMSVTRYEYKDQPPSGSALSWPTQTLMVLWDYRGTPAFGLFTDGTWAKPYQVAPGQQDCPIPGSVGSDRCFLHQWSVTQSAYDQAKAGLPQLSWMGSVLRNKRDGTGLEYKRARVYDPQTGRFTQEDPIGLAGGLNLYGYAGGDPVNFSDPFGLCVPWCTAAIGAAIGGGGAALGTMWYNHSQGRPLSENVGRNALVGAGAGAAVGLGVGLFGGGSAAGVAAAGVTVGPGTQRLIQSLEAAGSSMAGRIEAVSKWLPAGQRALIQEVEGGVMMSGGAGSRARQIIIEEGGRTVVKAFDVTRKAYETIKVIEPK
jgi:RHS repeat-associated protein